MSRHNNRRGTKGPLSRSKVNKLLKNNPPTYNLDRGRVNELLRPLDEWPIKRSIFSDLALVAFSELYPDGKKKVKDVVVEVSREWANPVAASRAKQIADRWGDWRKSDDSLDRQFMYEVQERKGTPLPEETPEAVSAGVQGACEKLGLDYAALNSIVGRLALENSQNPFCKQPVSRTMF